MSNGDDITVATAAQLVISDGSQGQVLGKTASGTGWVNPPSGTITGVTAGVGLTGGGTTGNVTVALAPPTAVNIGGVKAGTNITIAVDGTISASGGGTGGGVTSVGTGYRLTGGPITSTGTVTYVRTWADYCGTWTTSPRCHCTYHRHRPKQQSRCNLHLCRSMGNLLPVHSGHLLCHQ